MCLELGREIFGVRFREIYLEYRVDPFFWMIIVYPLIRCQRLGLYICSSASSEMKPMSILFRFSVLFAGMIGLHNAEEIGLHEACKTGTRFQSGEEMGLFLLLGPCTIFAPVTSKLQNDSFQLYRFRIPFSMRPAILSRF